MSLVVCATDLSPESAAVVSKAAELSKLLGLPLELFHVFDLHAAEIRARQKRHGGARHLAEHARQFRGRIVGPNSVGISPPVTLLDSP